MSWLAYADDEVGYFHPEFEAAANEALQLAQLDHLYEWEHHVRTPGSTTIPDFVLRMKSSLQWILALEIKRRPEAVFSTRYQFQAKGYAEENSVSYPTTSPKYFAISNLEVTLLFALNETRPPRECLLSNGIFKSGTFKSVSKAALRAQFVADMERLLDIVVSGRSPIFETVWPSILADFLTYVSDLVYTPDIAIAEPDTTNWSLVREYFGSPLLIDSSRVFILRCLMIEYLRGYLTRQSHPNAGRIPALQANRIGSSIANAIEALRRIDFRTL